MSVSKVARTLTLVLCCVTATGCAELLQVLQATAREPTLAFKDAQVLRASLSGLTLDTTWVLTNPNPLALSLSSVEYGVFIEGRQLLAGSPQAGLQVPAQGSTDLHFPAELRFADLAGVVQTFLTKDTAHWRAQGAIGVETPIGLLKLPLSREGDFEVPKVPQVQLLDPRVSNVSLAGATIEFPVVVTNRSSYSLPVSVAGALRVSGQPIGTLSTGDLGVLAGHGSRTVVVPLTVSFLSAASAVGRLVQGGRADVSFDAQVHSGGEQFPLALEQVLNFIR